METNQMSRILEIIKRILVRIS